MAVTDDVAKLGTYNSTDITNAVAQAFNILSLFAGSTLVEDANDDWDRIATLFAVHILDRQELQRKAKHDMTIRVPPLVTEEIRQLINLLELEPEDKEDLFIVSVNTPGENWYDPENPRE